MIDRDAAIQTLNMICVILLRRQNGLVRITEAELTAYQSGDQFVVCKAVEGEKALDAFMMTREEWKGWSP
ncbi:MAG: hypothetical protein Q7R68_11110 [Nitrospirales bacterium]|nr:hypothetical protein [Nitrospirales bacterium]